MTLYEKYPELPHNDFFDSLNSRETLTTAQQECVNDELQIPEKLQFELKPTQRVKEYYYRTDSNGDYLTDYQYVYGTAFDFLESIQDLNALAHGVESYHPRYKLDKIVELPEHYNKLWIKEFREVLKKVKRNKFRKIRSRNNHIRFLNAVVKNKDIEKYWNKIDFKVR